MPPRPFGNAPDILAGLVQQQPLVQQAALRLRQAQNEQTRNNLLTQFLSQADLSKLSPSDIVTKIGAITQDPNMVVNAVKLGMKEDLRDLNLAKNSILGRVINRVAPEGITQEEGAQIRATERGLGLEKQVSLSGLIQKPPAPPSATGRQKFRTRIGPDGRPSTIKIGNTFRTVREVLGPDNQPTGDIQLGPGGVVSVSSFGDKRLQDMAQRFNADDIVKKAEGRIVSARNMLDLINSGNPIADGAIPTFAARAAGEVGALTEADKAPFGGSRAIQARLKQVIATATSGKLTDENRAFIKDLAETFERAGFRELDRRARVRAKQGKATSPGFTEERIFNAIFPDGDFSKTRQPDVPADQPQQGPQTMEDRLKALGL